MAQPECEPFTLREEIGIFQPTEQSLVDWSPLDVDRSNGAGNFVRDICRPIYIVRDRYSMTREDGEDFVLDVGVEEKPSKGLVPISARGAPVDLVCLFTMVQHELAAGELYRRPNEKGADMLIRLWSVLMPLEMAT